MTRKDYILIGNAIRTALSDDKGETTDPLEFETALENLTDRLKKDNPNFDKSHFVDYCLGLVSK